MAAERLSRIADTVIGNKAAGKLPWDPNSTSFPNRQDVPRRENAPEGA